MDTLWFCSRDFGQAAATGRQAGGIFPDNPVGNYRRASRRNFSLLVGIVRRARRKSLGHRRISHAVAAFRRDRGAPRLAAQSTTTRENRKEALLWNSTEMRIG